MSMCPQCISTDLVTVGLETGGGPVRFCHCRHCEHRWWTDPARGAVIALPDVLDRVAS
ncbi:MAG: hypothetical protein H0V19_10640 [Euzebyales bacterium]|nr:hypothetical protein [Euzebyales bacterium]